MSNPNTHIRKSNELTTDTQESANELREHCNQYIASMMDLIFESQKENLKLLSQIQKNMLKQGRNLSETMRLNGNGYATSHQSSSNDVFKSFMDISTLMLDTAYQAAEKSANIAKDSMANHAAKTQAVKFNGKRYS
jgi:hypothetical protein